MTQGRHQDARSCFRVPESGRALKATQRLLWASAMANWLREVVRQRRRTEVLWFNPAGWAAMPNSGPFADGGGGIAVAHQLDGAPSFVHLDTVGQQ